MKTFIQEIYFLSTFIYHLNPKYSFYSILGSCLQALLVFLPLFVVQEILDALTNLQHFDTLIFHIGMLLTLIFGVKLLNRLIDASLFVGKKDLIIQAKEKVATIVHKTPYVQAEESDFRDFLALAEEEDCFVDLFQLHSEVLLSFFQLIIFFIILGRLSILLFFLSLLVAFVQVYIQSNNILLWEKWKPKYLPFWRRIDYYFSLLQSVEQGKEIRMNHSREFVSGQFEINEKSHMSVNQAHLTAVEKNSFKSEFLLLTQQILLFIILGVGVVKKTMTIGDFSLYLTSVERLNGQLVTGITAVFSLQKKQLFIRQLMSYGQNVLGSKEKEYPEIPKLVTLEFRNVWFRYPMSKAYILKGFSLLIQKGEQLSIVGKNGSGKSTFIQLLSGIYPIEHGQVLLNGKPIDTYSLEQRQSLVSILFQEHRLFSFSVEENIVGSFVKDDDRLKEVLEVSGLKEKVEQYPLFLTTYVEKEFDADGLSFSGGERQKIALARALYKQSEIIVFDEPTAALDSMNESQVLNNLLARLEDRTCIFITHRFIFTNSTHKIAVIDNGKVAEYGNHKTLMENPEGLYHSLFKKQRELLEEKYEDGCHCR
ncbi:ATP-binding cassette, subfamily B, bacterial [Enterococcus sp. AZ194]|uniref:ATP-binding cassette domain-containing protein n=1 Tax=Enterococcus sp. AZ194 TaxID=2774629 RepID=UPI003F1FC8F1